MARLIPDCPPTDTSSPGEYDIWLRLRDDADTRDWIVLHSLDIAKHRRKVSGELDFVVIVPEVGVLCLEVKACRRLHRNQAGWYYGYDPEPDARGPFKQASQGMHSLREYLQEHRPDLTHFVFWSAVILPYVNFDEASVEWHPWQVIDARAYRAHPLSRLLKGVLLKAREHLAKTPDATWFRPGSPTPTAEQSEALAQTLRPRFEFFEHPAARRSRLTSELKYFTDEQFGALTMMEMNPRVLFQGAAGTGKTFLALEAARRSAASGRRVLLLCYNRLLGEWLQKEAEPILGRVTVRHLHHHLREISDSVPPADADTEYWQHILPELALESILESDDNSWTYDELIIDEAQDILNPCYTDVLDLSLRGGLAAGRWRIFGDFDNQAIFTNDDSEALTPAEFCQQRGGHAAMLNLRINCRNTPRIASWAEVLGKLKPGYERVRRNDDRVEPRIVLYNTREEQQALLMEYLSALYDEGYQGQDVVVLSTRAGERATASQIEHSPWKERLRPFSLSPGGYIRYTTIHAFKGLEAPAIVVTDIDAYDKRSIALLFVAATRALDRLTLMVDHRAYKQISAYLTGVQI